MNFGSVCSGIEAASVAWEPLGWKARWFAEIEKFPSRVLAHHYPDVPNHGDMNGLAGRLVGVHRDIDVLVGGTPCQSFSVAGLRKGLADERGNLALEFARLAQALRPRWVVWENVPGVLSSGDGRDFGSIVGGLVELGYGVAWRVLDARFFGVPQRRQRLFLVGHHGAAAPAGAVLFEPEGVRRNPPSLGEARQDVAGTLGGGPGRRGWAPDTDRMTFVPEVARCLTASAQRIDTETEAFVVSAFDPTQVTNKTNRSSCRPDTAPTLANGAQPPAIAFHMTQDPISGPVSPALSRTSLGMGVAVAPCLDRDMAEKWGSNQWVNQWQGVLNTQAAAGMRVRRLTPRECERLQGFPDDYTAVPGAADGPRYAALGNSMAVPVMRWIGERIAKVDAVLTRKGATP